MSDQRATLAAEVRTRAGKGASRAERRAGRIPAIVYGGAEPPQNLSIGRRELVLEFEKGAFTSRLIGLAIAGQDARVLPREVQLHPVTDVPMHVDFLRVSADTRIRVMVAMTFTDEEDSPGLKRGGVINIVRHEVEFLCRADAIPDSIACSLAGLDIGDGIHISAITLPEGVRPVITDRDFTIATVAAPTIHVEEEEEKPEGEEGEDGEIILGEDGEPIVAEGEAGAEGEDAAKPVDGGGAKDKK
jgi:large subunit ribosomal protein L25